MMRTARALVVAAATLWAGCTPAQAVPEATAAGVVATPAAARPTAPGARVATASADPSTFEALLGDHFFDPQVIRVKSGTTVVWRNSSGAHDVVARDGSFRSSTLGDSFSHTFMQPGRFPFFCSFHPGEMQGEVVVGPAN